MYLYFDKTGVLKEIINDESLRQGNYGINEINVYIEGVEYTSIDVSYLLPSSSIVGPSNYDDFVSKEIPFDRKRDLRYFQYHKEYSFLVIPLEAQEISEGVYGDSPLDEAGVVHCEMTAMISATSQLKLGDVNFYVEEDPVLNQKYVAEEQYLSLSDYQFLRSLVESYKVDNVPYTGATANVNLGNHSLTADSVNIRSGVYTCSLDVTESGEPFVGTYHEGSIAWVFSVDETGVKTIATREWVNSKLYNSYVPYSGARLNVDIGTHTFRCGNLQVRGGVYSCSLKVDSSTKQPFLSAQQTIWNFSLDETGDTIVATREWATSQFLTETAGDAKYLPLTGGTMNGSVTILDSSGTGTDAFTIQGSTGFASLRDFNIDLNNPSPMLWLADTTSRDKGLILDNYGFKVAGGTSVLSKQYRLLLPRDETDSANKTLATREWAQGLLTPHAVGSATTSANVNGYNGAQFSIGDNNGLYFFTYGKCSVMIPVYGLVAGTEYKIASALNGGGQAGYQVKVLTYRLTGDGDLQIYQKENFIPTGYTAYLMRIKLY